MTEPPTSLTALLNLAAHGDANARSQAIARIYAELHALARRLLQEERSGHTLGPTALVNELYLRLFANESQGWAGREQFFAYARTAMAHVLIDHARRRNRLRRGGGAAQATPTETPDPETEGDGESLAALDQALAALAQVNPRAARVLELRCLAGLDVDETAAALQVAPRTVIRDWQLARGLLSQILERPTSTDQAHD